MELALYCPDFGYYEQSERRIGSAGGDFYTSVNIGPLFGQLLAWHFTQWAGPSTGSGPGPGSFQLVETGAHGGQLACDILAWLSSTRPDLFQRITYCLIEPSARRRQWQKARLAVFAEKIRWVDHIRELTAGSPASGVDGVIFSNELLDAFPVHRLRWDAAQQSWRELGVAWDPSIGPEQERFVWRPMPDDNEDSRALLLAAEAMVPRELKAVLPDGFLLDWSPASNQWWGEAAGALRRGVLLTIDYGLTAAELFAPHHSQGTLRGHFRHHPVDHLLAAPGQQDLTAPVNFSQLRLAGEREGLATAGLISQARFLTAAAEGLWSTCPPDAGPIQQFKTLTHPEHLGRAFKVFAQSRGQTNASLVTSGFAPESARQV
jgi:SAM-dependent MidA family methyltransferase